MRPNNSMRRLCHLPERHRRTHQLVFQRVLSGHVKHHVRRAPQDQHRRCDRRQLTTVVLREHVRPRFPACPRRCLFRLCHYLLGKLRLDLPPLHPRLQIVQLEAFEERHRVRAERAGRGVREQPLDIRTHCTQGGAVGRIDHVLGIHRRSCATQHEPCHPLRRLRGYCGADEGAHGVPPQHGLCDTQGVHRGQDVGGVGIHRKRTVFARVTPPA
mmetsp:Transcript_2033/g.2241  ORF Transcript_2033/g.2241 Transcript_2033/m.2241 type:complete len:214 (-) Transcript_2033:350-991(-)